MHPPASVPTRASPTAAQNRVANLLPAVLKRVRFDTAARLRGRGQVAEAYALASAATSR